MRRIFISITIATLLAAGAVGADDLALQMVRVVTAAGIDNVTPQRRSVFGTVKSPDEFDTTDFKARWTIEHGVIVAIINKETSPVFIDWERSSWVDAAGEAHQIMADHTLLARRFFAVPPGATATLTLLRADEVASRSGERFQIMLDFVIRDRASDYLFIFDKVMPVLR